MADNRRLSQPNSSRPLTNEDGSPSAQLNTWLRPPYEFNKCTHVNLTTEEKLIELSRTKSSLSINKLHMSPSSKYNGKMGKLTHHAFDFWNKRSWLSGDHSLCRILLPR